MYHSRGQTAHTTGISSRAVTNIKYLEAELLTDSQFGKNGGCESGSFSQQQSNPFQLVLDWIDLMILQ
jgi:hypothetical protein